MSTDRKLQIASALVYFLIILTDRGSPPHPGIQGHWVTKTLRHWDTETQNNFVTRTYFKRTKHLMDAKTVFKTYFQSMLFVSLFLCVCFCKSITFVKHVWQKIYKLVHRACCNQLSTSFSACPRISACAVSWSWPVAWLNWIVAENKI